jgi:hypothetical protein
LFRLQWQVEGSPGGVLILGSLNSVCKDIVAKGIDITSHRSDWPTMKHFRMVLFFLVPAKLLCYLKTHWHWYFHVMSYSFSLQWSCISNSVVQKSVYRCLSLVLQLQNFPSTPAFFDLERHNILHSVWSSKWCSKIAWLNRSTHLLWLMVRRTQ